MLKKIPKKIKVLCKKYKIKLTTKKKDKKIKKPICVLIRELKKKVKSKKLKFGESLPTDPVKKENFFKKKAKETVTWVKKNPKKAALGLVLAAGTVAVAVVGGPVLAGGAISFADKANSGLTTAANFANKAQELKGQTDQIKNVLPPNILDLGKKVVIEGEIPAVTDAIKETPVEPSKFGQSLPQRVFNFGKNKKTIDKKKAMDILKKFYRKNCKKVLI